MVSGSTVLSKIKDRINEVENEHGNLSSRVYDYEKKITSLMDEREENYSKLSAFYLPEIDAESVKKTLKEVQKEVQFIFEEKQARRKKVEELMDSSKENKKGLEEKFETITEKLKSKAEEHDKIKETVMKGCHEFPKYKDTIIHADKAEENLKRNKQRIDEVKNEAGEKLPAYENNKFFLYLLERGYGTSDYSGNFITKKLDKAVANIVNYDEAKKNYDFLKSMPGLMKKEVEERQKELDDIVKLLRKIESEEGEKHGLQKIAREGTELYRQRKEIHEKIEKLDEEYRNYSIERKDLDNSKGEHYKVAIKKLKEYLKGEDIASLKEKAKSTPGSEDDKAVYRIEEIDSEIRNLKDKSKESTKQRDNIGEKLEKLKSLQSKYTQKDYEASNSRFESGFDINNLLILYMAGQMSHDDVWRDIEKNQDFEHHSDYSSSSSYSSSSHDSDSGFGGGGFSSGGGFGGGGFSSGGGF